MYSGPGAGPMLTAAAAWDQLAEELHSSAGAYTSVITALTSSGWQGPSSAMMAEASAPYVSWLHSTAAHAEQTSTQAKAAASAYQTALAAMVPPPLITTNRIELSSLVASNFFGQNSPAIAANEADYDAMWAQDAAGMYGYAASSSSASNLPPFTGPPHTTHPTGAAAQAAATNQSAGGPTQLLSQLPTAMQQLAAPAPSPEVPSLLTYLLQIPSITSATASTSSASFSGSSIVTTNHALAVNALRDDAQGIGPFLAAAPATSTVVSPPAAPAGVGAPSAAMGRASVVGALSVPQSWAATAAPPTDPAAIAAPGAGAAATAATPHEGMVGEALLGTLAGRGVSNVAAKLRRPGVIPRSPAAG
jgi:PPE-repeat protein